MEFTVGGRELSAKPIGITVQRLLHLSGEILQSLQGGWINPARGPLNGMGLYHGAQRVDFRQLVCGDR